MIEYFILKPDFKRFLAAKAVALAFCSLAVISFFYTYTGALGFESLIWISSAPLCGRFLGL